MKKLNHIFLCFSLLFLFQNKVNAAASLTTSASKVSIGESFTVNVNLSSVASWNVHVTSTGPVNGCTINQADASETAMNISKTFSASCTSTGEGTIIISLSGDTTTETGDIKQISGTVNVIVSKPVSQESSPVPKSSVNNNIENTDNRSTNANLKKISVENFELSKIDDTQYTLSVPYNTKKIKIEAEPEDSNAKISGIGDSILGEGENTLEIIVTAENSSTKTYTIKITREKKEANNEKEQSSKTTGEEAKKQPINYWKISTICLCILLVLMIIYLIIERRKKRLYAK